MKKQNKNWEKKFEKEFISAFMVKEYKGGWEWLDEDLRNAGEKLKSFIRQLLAQKEEERVKERQRFIKILEELKPIKMDYLKWQWRTDLTRERHIETAETLLKSSNELIEEAQEKAKAWNRCRDWIERKIQKIIKEIKL